MGTSWLKAGTASLFFGIPLFFLFAPAAPAAAAVHNVSGWAWSSNTGWISMDCNTDPGGCAGPAGDYGLDIDDDGDLSGWAWSSQAGWICFGATCNGITPGTPSSPASAADHYCPGNVPCARYDFTDGQIHGWAYIIGLTEGALTRGWISLNCTDVGANTALPLDCGASEYYVRYDEDATAAAGEFYGYAWNGNADPSGDGWILFGCGEPHSSCGVPGPWGVTSTFVSPGWLDLLAHEGVYSPSPPPSTGTHLTDVTLTFTEFSAPAGSTLHCVFRMSDGTYRDASWNIADRIARQTFTRSYTITGSDAVADAQGNPVWWSYAAPPPDAFGCEITGTGVEQKAVSNRIAVHPSTWTFAGFGAADSVDAIRAKYCLDGNVNTDPSKSYFLNTDVSGNVVQCDTEGDLAFTLLKARGIPVEVRCYDNIDNDANLQRDCAGGTPATVADRNCRGITYLCIPHPPASAPEEPRP